MMRANRLVITDNVAPIPVNRKAGATANCIALATSINGVINNFLTQINLTNLNKTNTIPAHKIYFGDLILL